MDVNELQQTIDGLRRENHMLHRIIERARSYRGIDGRTCPLCSYDHGVFIARCEPHAQLHTAFAQMIDAYQRIQAGDIDGARSLLDGVTRYRRPNNPDVRPES